jgi:predicted transcriptional regulator
LKYQKHLSFSLLLVEESGLFKEGWHINIKEVKSVMKQSMCKIEWIKSGYNISVFTDL